MKQRIISFALALAVVMVAVPVSAQDVRANLSGKATGTPVKIKMRADVRADLEARKASTTERREERRENIEERKATNTERWIEMQKDLAKRKVEHVIRVFTATVERLEKIITRLESRIAKVKTFDVVTTESEAFVAEAKNHLSLAKSSIAALSSIDISGDKARDNFEKIRAAAAEVKGHIHDARTSLMKAIRSLKPGQRTATSTSDSEVE